MQIISDLVLFSVRKHQASKKTKYELHQNRFFIDTHWQLSNTTCTTLRIQDATTDLKAGCSDSTERSKKKSARPDMDSESIL